MEQTDEDAVLLRFGFMTGMAVSIDSIRAVAMNCKEPNAPCNDCLTAFGIAGFLTEKLESQAREWGVDLPPIESLERLQ